MFKRWIIIGLLSLLVLASKHGANLSAAQEATSEPTINPALASQMAELEQITQTLRGLSAKEQIEHRFPTRQETIDYLTATYDREFPPEEFDKLERFYVALGLLPADINLHDVYLNLLGSQVAGYYDSDTKTMNVLPTIGNDTGSSLSFTEQIIYVHEFTHALQDQYFGLNNLMDSPDVQATPDHSLAVTALVEGDATAIMNVYTQEVSMRNPLAAFGMLFEGLQAGNLLLPSGVPSILVSELLYPYENGMSFVVALYDAGGWDAVNAAYANPPTTSEQIYHPEKYLAGEGARTMTLTDASAALGDGWQSVWESALGEFYLRAHLATELSASEAAAAAGGWGGDDFRIYDNADGQLAWALRLGWDTQEDRTEFETLYAQYGANRFGIDSVVAGGCWQNADAALCLVPNGKDSLVVSAPTLEQAQALGEAS